MDSSNQPAPVGDLVRRYTDRYADLWWRSPTSLPDLGRTYTRAEQSQREGQIEALREGLAAANVVNFIVQQADITNAQERSA